ncbi:MAG TPA: AI-2E family transporter [Geminicoccaceae bacterium]|nr:AI-2E family transporter [Geminicoccaceae bacterium]
MPAANDARAEPAPSNGLEALLRIAVFAALGLFVLWIAGYVILLVFAAILVAILLRVPADWIAAHTGIPPRLAILLVAATIVLLLGGGGWYVAPQILQQTQELLQQIPQALSGIRDALEALGWPRPERPEASEEAAALSGEAARTAAFGLIGVAFSTFNMVVGLVFVLVIGIYLAVEPRIYLEGLLRLLPVARRSRWRMIVYRIGHTLSWWLFGQMISMSVIFVSVGLGLWLLEVPLALTLGLIAGLMTFIPNIGPIIALVPTVLVATTGGAWLVFYVVLLYTALQSFEGYFLTPTIQRRAIHMPQALILVAQVFLGLLMGMIGLALAAPLAAAVLVAVRMAYVEDYLGDQGEDLEPVVRRADA